MWGVSTRFQAVAGAPGPPRGSGPPPAFGGSRDLNALRLDASANVVGLPGIQPTLEEEEEEEEQKKFGTRVYPLPNYHFFRHLRGAPQPPPSATGSSGVLE